MSKYEDNKREGRCTVCGTSLAADETHVACSYCRARQRLSYNKMYYGRKRDRRCVLCGTDLPEGSKGLRCFSCRCRGSARQYDKKETKK